MLARHDYKLTLVVTRFVFMLYLLIRATSRISRVMPIGLCQWHAGRPVTVNIKAALHYVKPVKIRIMWFFFSGFVKMRTFALRPCINTKHEYVVVHKWLKLRNPTFSLTLKISSQLTINTAIVYMHRFYMYHSFTKFHRNVSFLFPSTLPASIECNSFNHLNIHELLCLISSGV